MKTQKDNSVLEYIGLDLKKIPEVIETSQEVNIKTSEIKCEKNYKVYKYISIKDINILITNSLRLDEPSQKMESINVLSYYLDEKNQDEYLTFLNSLKNTSIYDIKDIERSQKEFSNNIPSKIKYTKDYLWQIYYIKRTNSYYMIVPLEETKEEAFLYLLKKKIEKSREKIYVPICNINYENAFIEESKISKLENYIYYFTKKWPMIYEVHNKTNDISIEITGEIDIYENITSDYKMCFKTKEEINDFYELIKALFNLQMELANYFKIEIILDKEAGIHFYYNNQELTTSNLKQFYIDEIKNNIKNIEDIENLQKDLQVELNKLKLTEKKLNANLANKQKQIATFLQCKKTFFGRVKYFFKYSKLKSKNSEEFIDIEEPTMQNIEPDKHTTYYENMEDLVYICKELKSKVIVAETTKLDIQNLNIKIEILKKKIENATLYIQEIESHKKSIFEFWKFTNKDEKNQLTEGLSKDENQTKIEKAFNINEDLAEFGRQIDIAQRNLFTETEQDSILIAKTCLLQDINALIKNGEISSDSLQKLKNNEKLLNINENAVEHREILKPIDKILNITPETTLEEYTLSLKKVINNIESALKKSAIHRNLSVYSLLKPNEELEIFDLNPINLGLTGNKLCLYRLNLKPEIHLIAFSNIIFFNNRNKTLPIGMDYSTSVLLDLRKVKLKIHSTIENYIIKLEDNSPKRKVTKINIIEFDI